jgi:hypothetical protein
MHANMLLMEVVVAERLARARAMADQERLARAARAPSPPLRALLGAGLVRLGERLLGSPPPAPLRPHP